ncbi:MAG: leucyl aminopeptidase, partial [Blautia sp.]|nr:leucyl aminopeptidase [Blautia sp.]
MSERFALAQERVRGLAQELAGAVENPFLEFLYREAKFLDQVLSRLGEGGLYAGLSLEECEKLCKEYYGDILGEAYQRSFGNPAYAKERLGDYGPAFTFLYAELFGILPAAAGGQLWDVTVLLELFLQAASLFTAEDKPSVAEFTSDLRSYCEDYLGEMLEHQISAALHPGSGLVREIIEEADLTDLRYLYRYGLYVSDTEKQVASFLLSLPQEDIDKMAKVMVEGFREGFVLGRKDLSKKKTVGLHFHVGFERVVRRAGEYFKELGLSPIYNMGSAHVAAASASWVSSSLPSPQYRYDHRQDGALFMREDFVQKKLRCL